MQSQTSEKTTQNESGETSPVQFSADFCLDTRCSGEASFFDQGQSQTRFRSWHSAWFNKNQTSLTGSPEIASPYVSNFATRRGWSRPGYKTVRFGHNFQPVLRFESEDGSPIRTVDDKRISNYQYRFGDLDAWINEKRPNECIYCKCEKCNSENCIDFAACDSRNNSSKRNASAANPDVFGGFWSKCGHIVHYCSLEFTKFQLVRKESK